MQYSVAIHHPDDYDPSTEGDEMMEDIHALNRETIAAGVRVFPRSQAPAKLPLGAARPRSSSFVLVSQSAAPDPEFRGN
jgi:hypothetical protein